MYTYKRSEPRLWTAGHHDNGGNWHPESDHNSSEEAAERVSYLNGASALIELASSNAKLGQLRTELTAANAENDRLRKQVVELIETINTLSTHVTNSMEDSQVAEEIDFRLAEIDWKLTEDEIEI